MPSPKRPISALLVILAVAVVIRLPFLNQAISGDDVYYLAGAAHAQIDPLHPNHAKYVFLGDVVDLRGHPHPPLNAWVLGAILAAMGDVGEVPFHAVYILFSVVAALSMWSLAQRFGERPVWATLLFVAVPAFVINGNSLESDLPHLAFWMASVALFIRGSWLAVPAMALASMAAYQAVVLVPVLAAYLWLHDRRATKRWLMLATPLVTIAGWQLFERLSTGALPAEVLTGYFSTYGFQALINKLRSAGALSIHLLWIVSPLALIPSLRAWKRRDPDTLFLLAWIAIFFTASLAIFFAGSARYLLPLAAPLCLLASRAPTRWLAAGFATHLVLALSLAWVNYEHWDGYRRFIAKLAPEPAFWINGEWGLRHYAELRGGLALVRGQAVRPGQMIVSSDLAYPVDITTGGGIRTVVAEEEIRATVPLCIIGIGCRSGYSTSAAGFLPFDITAGPLDRVRAETIVERKPDLSWLPMNAPHAASQIVSGVYDLENDRYRWMGKRAVLLVKPSAGEVCVELHKPDASPATRVRVTADSTVVWDGPIQQPICGNAPHTSTITIEVDRTFSVRGDRRELGVVLAGAGHRR